MPDPTMLTIAASVAGSIAGKVVDATMPGAKEAVNNLVTLVRNRFSLDPQASQVLDAVTQSPEDNTEQLAEELERVSASDKEFSAQLQQGWELVRNTQTGDYANVNQINGDNTGTVNQFGNVGNITFN